LFQRQYVWTQTRQWEPLWEDIDRMAEKRLTDGQSKAPHFMGALVIDQMRTFGNQVPSHLIIDGQQRLTTFQIIMAVLRDLALKKGSKIYSDELDRYLFNSGIMENPDEERFKVWPTQVDQEAYTVLMNAQSFERLPSQGILATSNLLQAYRYFHQELVEFVEASESEEQHKRIEIIFQCLRDDLEVVTIELEGDDDPQVIFETLNARGEPLLPSDLLRNYIFWRASREDGDRDLLYKKYWLPFDQHFWKKEHRIGRLKRPRIDIFLQYFLESQKGDEVNVSRLFHEYKDWINEISPFDSVESELVTLSKNSEAFRHILEATPGGKEDSVFFWRIGQIDVGTINPLLLYISTHEDKPATDVAGMFKDLESYLFRRLICGMTTKNYNKIFLQVIRDLVNSGLSRTALQQSLINLKGEASLWPDDRQFAESWMTRKVYNEVKPISRVNVILRALEDGLRSAKSEEVEIHSVLTIEHVMPQDWYTNWPLSDGSLAKPWWDRDRLLNGQPHQEADERDALVHTIGNLTLLTQALNSSVSNAAFSIKKPEICKQSALALNRYFQDPDKDIWNADAIKKRAQELFEVAKRIWPYPTLKQYVGTK